MSEIDPGQLKAILVRIIQITNADRIEIYPLDDLGTALHCERVKKVKCTV
jgi:hypothetical protein